MPFDRVHAKDVPLFGERFLASYRFLVIDPRVHRSKLLKNQFFFLEKNDPLDGKKIKL